MSSTIAIRSPSLTKWPTFSRSRGVTTTPADRQTTRVCSFSHSRWRNSSSSRASRARSASISSGRLPASRSASRAWSSASSLSRRASSASASCVPMAWRARFRARACSPIASATRRCFSAATDSLRLAALRPRSSSRCSAANSSSTRYWSICPSSRFKSASSATRARPRCSGGEVAPGRCPLHPPALLLHLFGAWPGLQEPSVAPGLRAPRPASARCGWPGPARPVPPARSRLPPTAPSSAWTSGGSRPPVPAPRRASAGRNWNGPPARSGMVTIDEDQCGRRQARHPGGRAAATGQEHLTYLPLGDAAEHAAQAQHGQQTRRRPSRTPPGTGRRRSGKRIQTDRQYAAASRPG